MKSYLEIMLEQKQFKDPTDEDCLELARILEKEYGRPFTLEQAKMVGNGYISIFTTLANGRRIVSSEKQKGKQESNFLTENLAANKNLTRGEVRLH